MRKIVVNEYVSLDGVMESPEKWTFQYFNDEVQQIISESFASSDALLLGRVTYQGFADAFSSQSGGIADVMNSRTKYVVSTTLDKAEWSNSTLIKGNVEEEIMKLKQQPGKDIAISGCATLVQSLIRYNLVDEYSLLVFPIILGTGKRLFDGGVAATLTLKETKSLSSGIVFLSYEPAQTA